MENTSVFFNESSYENPKYLCFPYLSGFSFFNAIIIMKVCQEIYDAYPTLNINRIVGGFDRSLKQWKVVELGYNGLRDLTDEKWVRQENVSGYVDEKWKRFKRNGTDLNG